ncbi:MAG: NADH-quinone oxidoreductase subunit J [Acidobacteria bacterium]|nr:NADH-quinone oxidoreductase subunit J [Acidobacteriota bacterium]
MMLFFFYFFAALALIAALSVVLQQKTLSSALSLILCLGAIAMLYVQLEAAFIAVIQIIIYAGAIMVLFLFVIMLLDPVSERFGRPTNRISYVALPIALLFAFLIFQASIAYHPQLNGKGTPAVSDIAAVGQRLFSSYLLPFEVTSILMLVAVIGAVVLAKKKL